MAPTDSRGNAYASKPHCGHCRSSTHVQFLVSGTIGTRAHARATRVATPAISCATRFVGRYPSHTEGFQPTNETFVVGASLRDQFTGAAPTCSGRCNDRGADAWGTACTGSTCAPGTTVDDTSLAP